MAPQEVHRRLFDAHHEIPAGHYHLDPRPPPGARAKRSGSERKPERSLAARPGRPRPGLKTYRKSSPGASGAGEDYRRCIITTMTTAPELSDSPSILRRWRTDPACCTHHLAPDTDEQQGNQRLDLRLFDQARR